MSPEAQDPGRAGLPEDDRYRTLAELSPDAMFVTVEDRIVFANSALLTQLAATSPDQVLGHNPLEFVHESSREEAEARRRRLRTGTVNPPTRQRIVRIDGTETVVEVRSAPVNWGGRRGTQVIARDLSDRLQVEEALRASEARFRALFEQSLEGVTLIDAAGVIQYASPSTLRIVGYRPDELVGQVGLDYFHPDDAQVCGAYFQQLLQQPGSIAGARYRFRHKDGSWRWIDGIGTNLLEDPLVRAVVINYRDVTLAQEAEAALARSEARFRGLFEHVSQGVFQSSPEGCFIMVNPALVEMLGYASAEELLGLDTSHVFEVAEQRDAYRRRLHAQGRLRDFELRMKRKDGRIIETLVSSRAVYDPGGVLLYYEGTITDVSERRHLEDQLAQARKMEAVGRLAGGIAHDFNNLLTAIAGNVELLREERKAAPPAGAEELDAIAEAARSAADLTRQLLAFSRKQLLRPQIIDLNDVVLRAGRLLKRLLGEDIELVTSLDVPLAPVHADPGQMEQVVLNLCVNARDAMPEGGTLTIESRNVDLDAAYAVRHEEVTPGPHVMLAVRDTGVGMTPDVQAHLFEPFFTTKETGKGTGLGLATVFGIVAQSGGTIWVYSEPGRGTTFKVYLPVAARPATVAAAAETSATRATLNGTETILLVEDHEAVRQLARAALSSHGYRVIEATRGDEAVALATGLTAPPDLILTDVVMPGLGGREVAERLRETCPRTPVLFMSGYTAGAVAPGSQLPDDVAFLEKPFTPRQLLGKVRELLDARGR
ncbi:MAG: PAS domain S-box protein [Acidobacteriota bacterium]|nr:PAS domain S-box protein [Acidobacteriota bacterium]